jgi:hypothetical protein
MMLRSIDVVRSEGTPLEWRLEGMRLQQINLVVGKNACGKTRALTAIGDLAWLVAGILKPGRRAQTISYRAHLTNDTPASDTRYTLKVHNSQVVEEALTIGGAERIRRGPGGAGQMWFDKQSQFLEFQTPPNRIACASRRDSIQHPYLDPLYEWGHASLQYRFNSPELGKHDLLSLSKEPPEDAAPMLRPSVQVAYKLAADAFGAAFTKSLCDDMRKLDYALEDIGLRPVDQPLGEALKRREGEEFVCLYIVEHGVPEPITQFEMSDGMFRALSILIQVTHAAMSGKPSCAIIDDIGEGLDYERSCRLVQLLIEKAKQSGIQLVMATNDRFIMNNVPLEYWTVLTRERTDRGTQIRVYNHETHKGIFDDFAYTGLNNFDFFATRFFEEGLGERE